MMISVLSGSHRRQSLSSKAGRFCQEVLESLDCRTQFFDLAYENIPFWDEEAWQKESELSALWQPYSQKLAQSDGFVMVTPEWAGTVPPKLKNIFLFCSKGELAHKPALIVAVSSGMGGVYPVTELRATSHKNTRVCYVPDHVILRKASDFTFSQEAPSCEEEKAMLSRLRVQLASLKTYSEALGPVRQKLQENLALYPFGM